MPAPTKEPGWVQPFLAALGVCGNVTRSAALAGVDVTGPYNRRMRYPEFRAAWERVIKEREVRASSLDTLGTEGQGAGQLLGCPSTISSPAYGPPSSGRPCPRHSLELPGAVQPGDRSGEELVGVGAIGVRLGRGAASRWSKSAEERFLEELTASANVARAAAAAGFSAAAIYKRKLRDQHFASGWDAAIAVGRSRLEAHLIVAAERSFDPEGLPVAEGAPQVSVTEAIAILKHKPAAAASTSEWECDNEFGMSKQQGEELREKIIDKLERVRERDDCDKLEKGWTRDGENWIPPGWVRA